MQIKDKSEGFHADWFVMQFEKGREGPTLDFKARLYKFDDDDNASEFARDVIAFANIAARTNQKCFILFGVGKKDQGQRIWNDVRGQFPGRKKPQGWDNPNVCIHEKQVDGVQQVFYDALSHWIAPEVPDLALQYAEVDGVFVSYLEIKPTLASRPFAFKQFHQRKDGKQFNTGDVFVRKGAATARLASSEVPFLFQWNRVAYLELKDWREIIHAHLVGEFEKKQNLSPTFQPRASNLNMTAFDAVMQSLDMRKRIVVVEGEAGIGKTVLLHRIAYALAYRHNIELVVNRERFAELDPSATTRDTISNIADELEVVPPIPVPIFMTLRATFATPNDLANDIVAQIVKLTGKSEITKLDQIFMIPGSRWIILFDGVDEIRNRREFAPHFESWILRLPNNVQTVVTSRPALVTFNSAETVNINVEALTHAESLYLLQGKIPEDEEASEVKSKIMDWIQHHPGLLDILICPRALDGLIQLLYPSVSQDQSSDDRDRVQVLEMRKPNLSQQGNAEVPDIEVPPNEGESTAPEIQLDEPGEKWVAPQLALALQAITEYMRKEEVNRKRVSGDKAQRIADQARIELDETAWLSNWEMSGFDHLECERKGWITRQACEWNEDIGFIRYAYPRHYRFLCDLLRHYFCAEYAYSMRKDDDEVRTKVLQQGIARLATQSVLGLLNQIRIENGKPILEIS